MSPTFGEFPSPHPWGKGNFLENGEGNSPEDMILGSSVLCGVPFWGEGNSPESSLPLLGSSLLLIPRIMSPILGELVPCPLPLLSLPRIMSPTVANSAGELISFSRQCHPSPHHFTALTPSPLCIHGIMSPALCPAAAVSSYRD